VGHTSSEFAREFVLFGANFLEPTLIGDLENFSQTPRALAKVGHSQYAAAAVFAHTLTHSPAARGIRDVISFK
jgi:hypothetical protein